MRSFPFYVVFMIISPALGLISSLQSKSRSLKKWCLVLFFTLYGTILVPTPGSDGSRHYENVYISYQSMSFGQFLEELGRMFLLKNTSYGIQEDPYIHILSFFVGRVIGVPSLFFVLAAFIYGYFFAGSMLRLFKIFPKLNQSVLFFGFAVVFILMKSIDGVQFVRSFVGLWILLYACLSYYQTKNAKYLLLSFLPPFTHIGYLAMCIPAWGVLLLGVRKWSYAAIFFASFLFSNFNTSSVTQVVAKTEVGQDKVDSYYVERQSSAGQTFERTKRLSIHNRLRFVGVHGWAASLIAATLILSGSFFHKMDDLEASIFSIGILTKAFSNVTWFLYALSNRSELIAIVFILAALLLMWQRGTFFSRGKSVSVQIAFFWVALLLFGPYMIYQAANLLYWISIFLIALPVLSWVNLGDDLTLREVIRLSFGV